MSKNPNSKPQGPLPKPPPAGMTPFLRFAHLRALGIVNNYASLKVLIDDHGFPRGRWISTNARVWTQAEVNEWVANRPDTDPREGTRGRRKAEPEAGAETTP